MSEETKDQIAGGEATAEAPATSEHAHEHAHEHEHEHEHEQDEAKAIRIELEDLTEEGKQKAEQALHRKVEDIAYSVASQETRKGSVVALGFEVAREVYEAEQGRLLNDIRKEAVLPGFRKGKVPVKLLQLRLGEDANRDTVRSLATNALRQETAKQQFKFIARPTVTKFEVPADGQGAVTFEVEGEVEPTIEVKQYKGLKVEVETHPVTDEMVDKRLEALRSQNAVVETADADATVKAGDALVIDVEVVNDKGERMEKASREGRYVYNYQQELPESVSSQLEGKKAGESVTAKIEDKGTNRRGEEVTHEDTWTVTVREIKVNKLPALDDEFAKDLGDYENLEALRQKTRKELEEAEDQRQRQEASSKIYQQLLALNPIDAPRSLLAQQTYRMIMDDQYQLARMGLKLENVVQDASKYLSDQRASAEEMVKVQLLLGEIAKVENLEVSDEDVDKEIAELAEKTGRKPLAVRARLEAQKQLGEFRQQVAQRKLSDFLLANNTVEKVEAKPAEAPAAEEPKAE